MRHQSEGGNSPAWHGASSAGQRNGAAQFGMRSKEFGGSGYNQLLFDDTDNQGRIQLKSTQAPNCAPMPTALLSPSAPVPAC